MKLFFRKKEPPERTVVRLEEGAGSSSYPEPHQPRSRKVEMEGHGYGTDIWAGAAHLVVTDWCVRLRVNGVDVGSWSHPTRERES